MAPPPAAAAVVAAPPAPPANVLQMGGSFRDHVKGVKEMLDDGLAHVPDKYVRPESERPSLENVTTAERIPVLDLTALVASCDDASGSARRAEVVRQIGEACEEWGFFQVVNHGVDIAKIQAAVRRFYELPAEEKKVLPSHNADSGVTFSTGFNNAPGAAQDWKDTLVVRRRPGVCDGFQNGPLILREELLEYQASLDKLARVLYEAIFESLGLSQEYIRSDALPGLERLVLAINFYPPCPDPSLVFALSAHSDVSSFTILLPDEVPGLQIRKGDKWVVADPAPNAFIINVADQIEILTNAKYKSVEHRVVANKGRPRTSLAAFFGPREDAKIAPLPALCNEKNPPVFREVIFGEFLRDYYSNNLPLYKTTLNYAGGNYKAPSSA